MEPPLTRASLRSTVDRQPPVLRKNDLPDEGKARNGDHSIFRRSSNNLAILTLLHLMDPDNNANEIESIRILWEYKVFLLLFVRPLFVANVYNGVHRSKLECAQSLSPLLQVWIVQHATSYRYVTACFGHTSPPGCWL